MQAGSGRGYRHAFVVVGVDGLVALVVVGAARVVERAFDIGRQWHDAEPLGQVGHGLVAHGVEAHAVVAVFAGVEHFGAVFAFDPEGAALQGLFAGAQQAPPSDGVFGGL